ncbi:GIY-YIG nuclease family protein [Neorhodopirellula pilleata]|uniref:Bacteriophage T5 Orf172 DNA-binding domain-containing protein n=1 Tax=Neorhodopirellula pilleata TaxID=2714738 RepID=A0A5C6AGC9_9BACT|nr:GIY-YIG nuclease family protein [Neorhodopirellula pilleata]TWT97263.1 hypothetical protein Pla100_24130 [Neorhodopirellula pilleata]
MDPNWETIRTKWPTYGIDQQDEFLVDPSTCRFAGDGKHEIAVYSFGRYTRRATIDPAATYPLCFRFGIHFPSFTSDEEPAIGHLRTRFSADPTGLVEPVQLLAVLSTSNGPFVWREVHRAMAERSQLVLVGPENDHEVWYDSQIAVVMDAFQIIEESPTPRFVPMSPPDSVSVSISLNDLPSDPFPGYEIEHEHVSPKRQGKWAYEMKKHLRAGGTGTQPCRERIILREDLRRVDSSLFKGQLGWTVPETGFSIKPGRTSLQVTVECDSGFSLDIDIYWIDFIREELADELSSKTVESFRDTPFDANPDAGAKWMLDLPFFKETDCRIVGHGLDEVYAYTYLAAVEQSAAGEHRHYPMKIGYTSGLDGAVRRVASQFPSAIAHDAHIQFIGRCDNGRAIEGKIHKALKKRGGRVEGSPGKEWYWTTADEVAELFDEASR